MPMERAGCNSGVDQSDSQMSAAPVPEQAVEVKALRKAFRSRAAKGHQSVVAVDNVDFTVRKGELVVLLGPSGCGKTTLLRSIAGLEKPDSGEVAIGGRTVFSLTAGIYVPPEDRRIGMMFQSYALWPHMTVYQNVAYPLVSVKGVTREAVRAKVQDVLAGLGVAGLDHRYPGELSGGQQQRVALARALVGSPSLLLFDEPLSNVDAKVRRRLRAQLRELKQQTNFAGVYVTHDQEEAMELADTLAVMEHGKIRQVASSEEVYNRPASVYVADFVGEINLWAAAIESVDERAAVVSTQFARLTIGGVANSVRPGTKGWLVIRPERVNVVPVGSVVSYAVAYRSRGKVLDSIYFGARCEIRVEIGGTEVMAWLSDDDPGRTYPAQGDEVDVLLAEESFQWLCE